MGSDPNRPIKADLVPKRAKAQATFTGALRIDHRIGPVVLAPDLHLRDRSDQREPLPNKSPLGESSSINSAYIHIQDGDTKAKWQQDRMPSRRVFV